MARQRIIMLLDNPLASDARVEKEAASLTKAGHLVTIHAVTHSHLPQKEVRNGYTIVRDISTSIDHPFSRDYKTFSAAFVAQLVEERIDVVHCHDYKMIILGAQVVTLQPGIKLIYDAHEFLPGWPLYQELAGWLNKLKGYLVWKVAVWQEGKAIQKADAVVTVGQALALEMQKEFGLKKAPTVVRNIPERYDYSPQPNYYKEKYHLPKDALVFVHSGNIYHTSERIQMMMEVVLSVKNAYLVFIGDSSRLKALEKANTNARVLFHPYAQREELFMLMHAADFGIVHTWQPEWRSHWLSLPNRILEYTMAGLPVIATAQPEFLKLGKEFGNMVFYTGDVFSEMVKAIEQAIVQKEDLRAKAMAAAQHLSWDAEVQPLLNVYQSL